MLCMMIALAAAFNMTLYRINVDNAFQCTPKLDNASNPPIYPSMPPLYMAWFQTYFPTVVIHGEPPYVLQNLKTMQGTKQAGRAFYKLIKILLAKKGVHPTSIDPGFFVFVYKTEWLVFICCETDDFLLATNSTAAYTMICNTIKEALV